MTPQNRSYKSILCSVLTVYPGWLFILLHILLTGKTSGLILKTLMSTEKPIITGATQNETSFVGGLAILHCTVINLGTRTVIWRKMGKTDPITIGTMTYTADNRFQMVPVPHADQWNLVIKDVQHKDTGMYECQIASKDRSIRKQVQLTVKDSPVPKPGIQISPITYVEKGDRIVLSCNATSIDLDWYKKGQKVTTDPDNGILIRKQAIIRQNMITSFLEIEKATMEDDSDYVCRSTDLMNANVKVHVLNAGTLKEKREQSDTKTMADSSTSVGGTASSFTHAQVCLCIVAIVTLENSWNFYGT